MEIYLWHIQLKEKEREKQKTKTRWTLNTQRGKKRKEQTTTPCMCMHVNVQTHLVELVTTYTHKKNTFNKNNHDLTKIIFTVKAWSRDNPCHY